METGSILDFNRDPDPASCPTVCKTKKFSWYNHHINMENINEDMYEKYVFE